MTTYFRVRPAQQTSRQVGKRPQHGAIPHRKTPHRTICIAFHPNAHFQSYISQSNKHKHLTDQPNHLQLKRNNIPKFFKPPICPRAKSTDHHANQINKPPTNPSAHPPNRLTTSKPKDHRTRQSRQITKPPNHQAVNSPNHHLKRLASPQVTPQATPQ